MTDPKDRTTNPHGANANIEDPREQVMWDFYMETVEAKSPNAYQSAINAGYGESHAKNITRQGWFAERSRKMKSVQRVEKAEEFFDELQAMDIRDGKTDINPHLLKAKLDISKFLTSTQGKDKGYSMKTEVDHTTNGKDLPSPIMPVERYVSGDNRNTKNQAA